MLAEIQSVVFLLAQIINCFPKGDKQNITFLLLHARLIYSLFASLYIFRLYQIIYTYIAISSQNTLIGLVQPLYGEIIIQGSLCSPLSALPNKRHTKKNSVGLVFLSDHLSSDF